MPYEVGNFSVDTAVTADPTSSGRYRAKLPSSWNLKYVFGGITMATALNAARSSLRQSEFELLSASATFLKPIPAGELTLDVKPLRAGKGAEQFTVDARSGAGEHSDLHVVCTFGPKRDNETRFTDLRFPEVARPDEVSLPKLPSGLGMMRLPYHSSVEVRPVLGNVPWDSTWAPGPARWMGWYRLRKRPRLRDGSLDPLAYVPAADMLGHALRQAQGPHVPPSFVVSLEIGLHVFARTDSEWLLQDTQVSHAADGYLSGTVNLWDEHGQLVARASHRALLRPLLRQG